MNYIVGLLLVCGLFFFAVGAVGVIRLPDFYTRLHSAGMLDSMGLLLCMGALALLSLQDFGVPALLTCLKIVLIVVFVYITSPTATHAIVDAGVRAGLKPWTKRDENVTKDSQGSVQEEEAWTHKHMERN